MHTGYQRVLVPISGSDTDIRALDAVGDMAARRPVDLMLVYVVEVQQAMPLDAELPVEIDRGEAALLAAENFAKTLLTPKQNRVGTDLLQARSAGAAIVDEAIERRVDTIVVAGQNRTIHGKTHMGETIAYILKNAPCDVVVLRASPEVSSN